MHCYCPFPQHHLHIREQKEFETYLSIASSVPSALAVIAHAIIGYKFSIDKRAIISLVGPFHTAQLAVYM